LEQPKSFILEERQEDGTVRFYTLSQILKNTMDLEDFITRVDWKEKLKQKPLVGLEVALAGDLMFAKQRDMKYANFLVTETEKAFVVTSIDHEFAGDGCLASQIYVSEPAAIVQYIRDLDAPDVSYNSGTLAGDPRAYDFIEYVFKQGFMHKENILAFYEKVAKVSARNVGHFIHAIDGENGLISDKERDEFQKMIDNVQYGAKDFLLEQHKSPFLRIK
jgi:hypothetical protein